MGRKEYFRKRTFSPGHYQGRNGTYGRNDTHQPKHGIKVNRGSYASLHAGTGRAYQSRALRGRAQGNQGNFSGERYKRIQSERYGKTYGPYVRKDSPAYEAPVYKEKELLALQEKMHARDAWDQRSLQGKSPPRSEVLGTGGPQKAPGVKSSVKVNLKDTSAKAAVQAGGEKQAGPEGRGPGAEGTEELKKKMHVKFPEETGAYWKMYAAKRITEKSRRKKQSDAKERGREYYKKRRQKEVKKRKMGHLRSRPRGYSQYIKAYKKEGKRIRKDRYKGRRDAAKAQMKQAFRKSAYLHFSKALGSLSGSYEEDMAGQNPMGFLSSFVSGAFQYAGKRMANLLIYVLGGVLSALMPLFLILLPFLLILCLLVSLFTSTVSTPELYFNGGFAGETKLLAEGDFIDNAIQAHFDALDAKVRGFAEAEPANVVVYANGYRYNKNSVLAVYFSILCTRKDYNKLYQKKNKEYPPYLLADTDEERSLLREIFGQMNYYKETQVSYTAATGVDPVTGEPVTEVRNYTRLTVYNLTISQWLSEHPGSLTKKAEEMLDLLKKYETVSYGGGSGYTPLGDITMPEGADENLVYMAATLKAEAGGESQEGQIAVGFVIWNRAGGALSGVKGACLAPGQFSCWGDGSAQKYLAKYTGMTIEEMNADPCYRVCAAVTTGQTTNPIGTKKYYCNPDGCKDGPAVQWEKIRAHNSPDQIQVIGNHVFCENGWW